MAHHDDARTSEGSMGPILAHLHTHAAEFPLEELQLALRNQGTRFTLVEIERVLRSSKLAKEVSPGVWVAQPQEPETSKQKNLW